MFIEIEKKFEITQKDLNIIKNKCKLKSIRDIEDIYLDTDDYKLLLNRQVFRIRNGENQFKDMKTNILSEEYKKKEAEEKLKELNIKFSNLKKIFIINTHREKYKGNLNGRDFLIDYDKHKYGERYEIEVKANNEKEGIDFINKIIKFLNLDAIESKTSQTKGMKYIKNELPEVYKKIKIVFKK